MAKPTKSAPVSRAAPKAPRVKPGEGGATGPIVLKSPAETRTNAPHEAASPLNDEAQGAPAADGPKWPRRKPPSEEMLPVLIALGEIVKAHRKAKNLTQLQLAQKCGFNASAIFMLETGRQNMTIKSLMTVATALDIQLCDLFPREAPAPSAKILATAETMVDLKKRVVAHLDLLDRLAEDLREESGVIRRLGPPSDR